MINKNFLKNKISKKNKARLIEVVKVVSVVVIVLAVIIFVWQRYQIDSMRDRMVHYLSQSDTLREKNIILQAQLDLLKTSPAGHSVIDNGMNDNTDECGQCQVDLKFEKLTNSYMRSKYITEKPNTYIYDGSVYYTDANGESTMVAERIEDEKDITADEIYFNSELSPNGKYIMYNGYGWEIYLVKIYDIENKEIHYANNTGYSEWLPDNRLRVTGQCGMGISCGIYESISGGEPWILEENQEYSCDGPDAASCLQKMPADCKSYFDGNHYCDIADGQTTNCTYNEPGDFRYLRCVHIVD